MQGVPIWADLTRKIITKLAHMVHPNNQKSKKCPLPVETLRDVGILWILDELVEHPGDGGGADPLPGMDAAVDPDRRLVAAPAQAHLYSPTSM